MPRDQQPGTGDPFQEGAQNPLPAARTPFQAGNAGSDVPMIQEAVKADILQKQAMSDFYHKHASDLNGLLYHINDPSLRGPDGRSTVVNPETGKPYTDAEIQQVQTQRQYAEEQWEKSVGGFGKGAKGAAQKARAIIDFLHGRRGGMQQPPAPNYPTTVSDAGVSTASGWLATPNYATTVSDAGVSYDPRRGGTLAPPPQAPLTMRDALQSSLRMPFATHGAKVQQQIADTIQGHRAMIDFRKEVAPQIGLKEGTREYDQWVATGNMTFGGIKGLQLKPVEFVDPDTHQLMRVLANFDPNAGTLEWNGKDITNIAQQADKPQMIKYIKYDKDNKPYLVRGTVIGTFAFDANGQPLSPDTTFFMRGLLGTDTLSQKLTVNPVTGQTQINTLERLSTPKFNGQPIWDENENGGLGIPQSPTGKGSVSLGGATPQGQTPAGGTQATTTPARGNQLPAAPKSAKPQVNGAGQPVAKKGRAGQGNLDALGVPLGIQPSQWKAQTDLIRPVQEAATQLFGDPQHPEYKSMKDFSHLADDDGARNRLGKAFQLTFQPLEEKEKKEGGLWNLIQTYAGMPNAIADARQGVREQVIGILRDHPEEMEYYDHALNAWGSQAGMRTINKGSATDTSITRLENEVPLVGWTAFSQNQYNDKLSTLAENVTRAMKTIGPVANQQDQDYFESQISKAPKSSRKIPEPPSSGRERKTRYF